MVKNISHLHYPLNPFNSAWTAGFTVNFANNRIHQHISLRDLKANRHLGEEISNHQILIYANHGIARAHHPNIGNVGCAFGKNTLIRSLNVGMRTRDKRHPAVQIPTQSHRFACRFRVKIH
ncbi:MAG: hypothetical protein CEO40_137 [Parcubacteria group bacterium LiPW_72]|nr:MAG: hypothetical protein CEO40_137 [Parcubacteria group bacterium LiPW_72]